MKKIALDCLPEGKQKAVTMSFDDGKTADVRLAKLFRERGVKATFHYNSGNIGRETYVTEVQVREFGRYHEISVHSCTHPFLDRLPLPAAVSEVMEDRRQLEKLADKPVRGMSYPYGTYSEALVNALRACGIEYARTIQNTGEFDVPEDLMKWHPTCHQSHDLDGLYQRFLNKKKHIRIFYVWGHSYEFDRDQSWERMEAFCDRIAGDPRIWYATNLELADYITAMRSLKFSVDCSYVYNPSAADVWILVDDVPVKVPAGAQMQV